MSETCIDHVFTNIVTKCIATEVINTAIFDHHCILILVKKFHETKLIKPSIYIGIFKDSTKTSFKNKISAFDWENILHGNIPVG